MNIQANIDEGYEIVEYMLDKPPISFSGRTLYEIPDESGIYVFSDRRTHNPLYVGQSGADKKRKGTLRSRMKDHWDGTEGSDLAKKLTDKGIVQDKREGREWIKEHVVIRYMMSDEFEMDILAAERFAIRALRPPFNN